MKAPSDRTRLRRIPKKAAYAPEVIPTPQWRKGERIHRDGSAASRGLWAGTGCRSA